MSEWQPIETAPKDGTDIFGYGLWAGEITGPEQMIKSVDIIRWNNGLSDFPGDEWWECLTGDYYATWLEPTHWMPIPDLPK